MSGEGTLSGQAKRDLNDQREWPALLVPSHCNELDEMEG